MLVGVQHLPHSLGENPTQATPGSAGFDIKAAFSRPKEITLAPGGIKLIPTGLVLSIPFGYEGQLRARSGLSLKGLTLVNGVGTIDSDYRDELKVPLINLSGSSRTIKQGDRIAQLVISKLEYVRFVGLKESLEIENNQRVGGFGSTGE